MYGYHNSYPRVMKMCTVVVRQKKEESREVKSISPTVSYITREVA